jgi:tetratricopeptide (TPR) repeat protein
MFQKLWPQSRAAYEQAATLAPATKTRDVQLLRQNAAIAAEKSGDAAGALELWRALLRDFPDSAFAQRKLRQLEAPATPTTAATESSTQ